MPTSLSQFDELLLILSIYNTNVSLPIVLKYAIGLSFFFINTQNTVQDIEG